MAPDGKTMHSYGYDAETWYAEKVENGESKSWYFFKNWINTQYGCTVYMYTKMFNL
jgi:hypothetical protein